MWHLVPSVAFGLGVLLGGTFGGLAMALFAGRRANQLEQQVRWLRHVRATRVRIEQQTRGRL